MNKPRLTEFGDSKARPGDYCWRNFGGKKTLFVVVADGSKYGSPFTGKCWVRLDRLTREDIPRI